MKRLKNTKHFSITSNASVCLFSPHIYIKFCPNLLHISKHFIAYKKPLLTIMITAEPDEPPNKARERRQSKRTRKQGRECAAVCLAVCCFHREGPHSNRVHNGVAALQNYSDFALLEELPIIKSLKNIVNETCDFNNNASHEQLLDSLRQKLKPVSSAEDFDWRELGFQSRNCRTDFRGCGLEGLRCLHYLVDNYSSDYESYINHSNMEGKKIIFKKKK